jgi:hypothetical protein
VNHDGDPVERQAPLGMGDPQAAGLKHGGWLGRP